MKPKTRLTFALAMGILLLLSAGCAERQPAKVAFGDPAVFTALHWRAAQETLQQHSGTAGAIGDLNRYFGTPVNQYQTVETRMDLMLDSAQRRQSIAQAVAASMALEFELSALSTGQVPSSGATGKKASPQGSESKNGPTQTNGQQTSNGSPSSQPASAAPSIDAIYAIAEKLATQASQAVAADSPFDAVDRVSDFYAALILKEMRLLGTDSSALPPEQLYKIVTAGYEYHTDAKPRMPSQLSDIDTATLKLLWTLLVGTAPEADFLTPPLIHEQGVAHDGAPPLPMEILGARIRTTSTKPENNPDATQSLMLLARWDELRKSVVDQRMTPRPPGIQPTDPEVKYNATVKTLRDDIISGGEKLQVNRVIRLVFQVHLDPGTDMDQLVQIRANIVGSNATSSLIRIVRLHPTRTYDLEDQVFAQTLAEQTALTLSGEYSNPGIQANVKVRRELATRADQTRRFLSRIPKQCSWADATKAEFGWNFYPTNLVVRERTGLEYLASFFWDPTHNAGSYKIESYLEGGARDCQATLVVPRDLKSIRLEITGTALPLHGGRPRWTSTQERIVELPPYTPYETAIMLGGDIPATSGTNAPSTPIEPDAARMATK